MFLFKSVANLSSDANCSTSGAEKVTPSLPAGPSSLLGWLRPRGRSFSGPVGSRWLREPVPSGSPALGPTEARVSASDGAWSRVSPRHCARSAWGATLTPVHRDAESQMWTGP